MATSLYSRFDVLPAANVKFLRLCFPSRQLYLLHTQITNIFYAHSRFLTDFRIDIPFLVAHEYSARLKKCPTTVVARTTLATKSAEVVAGTLVSRVAIARMLRQSANVDIHSEEPYYDEEDIQEEYEPEPAEDGENLPNGDEEADNVIVSGDPAAAAKDNVKSHKEKKIPNELRITTPYMTKYEKARILGTRALQIRYGSHSPVVARRQMKTTEILT